MIGFGSTEKSFGQGMHGRRGGWGTGSQYCYDTKTVEIISGQVLSVDRINPTKGTSYGVHLMLKTKNEILPVHLGLGWFLENQDIKIVPKDKIRVKGSRITFDGKPALIAAEIQKGDEILLLRDAKGTPVWAGWRRR